MSLQNVSNQFNSTLTQYQKLYSQYISLLNSSNNSLTTISNSSYTSPLTLSNITNSSLQNCLKACSSNKSCTGATFYSKNRTCTVNGGTGNIVKANGSTAIVSQLLSYSYQLQQLNNQLISLNSQMLTIANSNKTAFQKSSLQNQQQDQILQQNYQVLINEREQLNQIVNDYETADQAYNNSLLIVNSNYLSYVVLLIISLLLIFLLARFSLTGQQTGGGINGAKKEAMLLFGIMVVFLGLSNIYKNNNIYLFVSILLISYILAKMKIRQLN
jgi:hypothetical protein